MTATLDAVPLARRITEHAYKAGASLVTTLFTDEESALLRFRYGPDASFDAAASWLYEGMAQAYRSGAARLAITGNDPSLLSKEDPEKVSRVNRATSKAYRPALELIARHEINWTIVACATPAWAAAVFPDLPQDEALARLWDAIFAASRADQLGSSGRVERTRREPACARRPAEREALFGVALPGTRHGSPRRSCRRSPVAGRRHNGGKWAVLHSQYADRGGFHHAAQRSRGRTCDQHQAAVVSGHDDRRDFRAVSRPGQIVEAHAARGNQVLQRMIETDEGARRLGEVSLVPHSSPIASSGLLFMNTLFDENAACHIALGQAYSTCLKDGDSLTPEQLASRGANSSLIHVDWMIGSNRIDVDGISAAGDSEPVMRAGEWV